MKYNVHVYAVVRVKLTDIEAESQEKAIEQAEEIIDVPYFQYALGKLDHEAEYAEENEGFLVDEVGDEDYERSTWYAQDGVTKIEGNECFLCGK